jgi:hypothetical protein
VPPVYRQQPPSSGRKTSGLTGFRVSTPETCCLPPLQLGLKWERFFEWAVSGLLSPLFSVLCVQAQRRCQFYSFLTFLPSKTIWYAAFIFLCSLNCVLRVHGRINILVAYVTMQGWHRIGISIFLKKEIKQINKRVRKTVKNFTLLQ